MNLESFLKEANLPDFMLDVKFLAFPPFGFENNIIHLGTINCSLIKEGSRQEHIFYSDMLDAYYFDANNFKLSSFNDFLNNVDSFCKECSQFCTLNESDGKRTLRLNIEEIIMNLQLKYTRLMSEGSFSNVSDWALIAPSYLNNFVNSFEPIFVFNEKLKNKLTLDRFPDVKSVETFREKCLTFLKKENFEAYPSYTFNLDDLSNLEHKKNFEAEIFDNKIFDFSPSVIFDSSAFSVYTLDTLLNFSDEKFLTNVIFYPGFQVSPYSVLPYVEFEVFKSLLTASLCSIEDNQDYYNETGESPDFDVFESKSVFCPSNAFIVAETMEKLFEVDNSTLNNYFDLFEIAVNV